VVQIARPSSDITANWTPTTGATLFACIDETSANDDTDAIDTGANPVSLVCEVKFGSLTDPLSSSGHVVRYRFRRGPQGGKNVSLTADLRQGATSIASWAHLDAAIVNSYTTFQQTLSSGQADSITDYTDLRLRLTATTSGGGGNTGVRFTWTELEVPDGTPTISPDPVTAPIPVAVPTLSALFSLSPATVATAISVAAPALSDEVQVIRGVPPSLLYFFASGVGTASSAIAASSISVSLSVVAPTLSVSMTIGPAAVTTPILVTGPTLLASVSLFPAAITVPILMTVPTLSASVSLSAAVAATAISVAAPTLSAAATLAVVTVGVPVSVTTLTLLGGVATDDAGSFIWFSPLFFQTAGVEEGDAVEVASASCWFGSSLFQTVAGD